jgi:hypothetical protein
VAAPRKFDPETRERGVQMYQDRMAEFGDSKRAARQLVAGNQRGHVAQLGRGPLRRCRSAGLGFG